MCYLYILDVILIIADKCLTDVKRLLSEQCPPLSINIDYVALSNKQLDIWSTADALRSIADKIKVS